MSLERPTTVADAISDLTEERRNATDAMKPSLTPVASDMSESQTTATDEIELNPEKAVVSEFDAMVQAALKEMNAKMLKASVATAGGNEQQKNRDLDAEDVGNLTDMLEQINQVLRDK